VASSSPGDAIDSTPAGSLSELHATGVFRLVLSSRFTGLLTAARRGIRKTLQLDRGAILLVASTDPDDQLGEWLLESGQLTCAVFEEIRSQVEGGERIESVLEERGILTASNVHEILTRHMVAVGSSILGWHDGDFALAACPAPPPPAIAPPTSEIIRNGVEQITGWSRLSRAVGGMEARYRITGDAELLGDADLTTDEGVVLRVVRDEVSVRDACGATRLDDVRVLQILLTLWTRALLVRTDEPVNLTRDRLAAAVADPTATAVMEARASVGPTWDLSGLEGARANVDGRLDGTNLPEVLRTLYVDRSDQTLRLQSGSLRVEAQLSAGAITAISSNKPETRLGDILIRLERVTAERVREIVAEHPGERLGDVLLSSGEISADDLRSALDHQIRDALLPAFNWIDGWYSIVERPPGSTDQGEVTTFTTGQLILEGVREMTRIAGISDLVLSTDAPFHISSDPRMAYQKLVLRPEEGFLLSRIDGRTTLRDVAALSPLSETETHRVLYAFLTMGLIEPQDGDSLETPLAPPAGGLATLAGDEVAALFPRLDSLDHFQLLGVDRAASSEEIERAFRRMASKFHPDRGRGAETRRRLETIFTRVLEAIAVLRDPTRRFVYDRELDWKTVDAAPAPAAPATARDKSRTVTQVPGEVTPTPPKSFPVGDIARSVLQNAREVNAAPPGPTAPDAKRIDRYRIIDELGAGSMGIVYRARDELLERDVALKVITGAVSPEARARFEREARAAARLQHPNVVVVFDLGVHADRPFLAMELLAGEDLKAYLKRNTRLSLATSLEIMIDVCHGVGHCHERGIVHRDIKPANIFVQHDGRAKVMDFGVAKIAEETAAMTATGMVVGTPQYLAPEQLRGAEADHRADIFALGSILYEMLVGQPAFRGKDVSTILYQVAHGSPPPLIELGVEVPSQVEEAIFRALRKDPDERYESTADLAAELGHLSDRVTSHW